MGVARIYGCWSCGCSVLSLWITGSALLDSCDLDIYPSEVYCVLPWSLSLVYGVFLAASFIATVKLLQNAWPQSVPGM